MKYYIFNTDTDQLQRKTGGWTSEFVHARYYTSFATASVAVDAMYVNAIIIDEDEARREFPTILKEIQS